MMMSKLPSGGKFTHRGAVRGIIVAAAAAIIIVIIVASAVIILASTSSGTKNANSASSTSSSGSTTTSSQSTRSSSIQSQGTMSTSCITVVPYDSIEKQFGGCVYTLSVLYNGDYYTQKLPNGTMEANLGWTLLIEASQISGPSENVTFGWDPAGPSTASGERLPGPASATLLDGNLTIEWRLYNSTVPRLYAWIITSSPIIFQQTTSSESTSVCQASSWPSQVSTSYQPVVQQIEQNPAFIDLTNGLCYSFTLNYYGESQGESLTTFVFNQYNGTIIYPCGTFPAKLIVRQIQVTVVLNGVAIKEISSMYLENDMGQLNVYAGCGPSLPPVEVHSVTLVPPYTPAGPTVKVTLYASPDQLPVTNLTAILSLTGKISNVPVRRRYRVQPALARATRIADRDYSRPRVHRHGFHLPDDHRGDLSERSDLQLRRSGPGRERPTIGNGSQSSPASCLREVPDTASIAQFGNSTFSGYSVTYVNGTENFFSLDSCPVPVKPDLYDAASAIESNSSIHRSRGRFASYEVAPLGQAGMSNSSGNYTIFAFYLYSSQRLYPCGGTFWNYRQLERSRLRCQSTAPRAVSTLSNRDSNYSGE